MDNQDNRVTVTIKDGYYIEVPPPIFKCTYRSSTIPSIGDGSCLFYSILNSLDWEISVDDLRRLLRQTGEFYQMGLIDEEIKQETIPGNWGGESCLWALSCLLSINICIHEVDSSNDHVCKRLKCPLLNTNYTLHLLLRVVGEHRIGNHYDGLIQDVSLISYIKKLPADITSLLGSETLASSPQKKKYIKNFSNFSNKSVIFKFFDITDMTKPMDHKNVHDNLSIDFQAITKFDLTLNNLIYYFNLLVQEYDQYSTKQYQKGYEFIKGSWTSGVPNPIPQIIAHHYRSARGSSQMIISTRPEIILYDQGSSYKSFDEILLAYLTKNSQEADYNTALNKFKGKLHYNYNLTTYVLLCSIHFNIPITLVRKTSKINNYEVKIDCNRKTNQGLYVGLITLDRAPFTLLSHKETHITKPLFDPPFKITRFMKTITYTMPEVIHHNKIDEFLKIPLTKELLHVPEPNHYSTIISDVTPDIRYDGINRKTQCYEFSILDIDKTLLAGFPEHYSIPIAEFKNFIHDFTFSHLVTKTDISFSELNLKLNDSDDQRTPDYMTIKKNHLFVIEFTTRYSTTDISSKRALQDKLLKYKDMILKRVEKYGLTSSYYIIACNRMSLYTNLSLNDDERNLIVYRYRTANKIMNQVIESKDYVEAETEMTKKQSQIQQIFNSIRIDRSKISNKITNEMIKNITRDYDKDDKIETDALLQSAWNQSIEEVLDEVTIEEGLNVVDGLLHKRMVHFKEDRQVLNSFQENYETRSDLKACVQLPFIILKSQEDGNKSLKKLEDFFTQNPTTMSETLHLWSTAIQHKVRPNVAGDFVSEIERLGKTREEEEEIDKKQKPFRRYYNRYRYDITHAEMLELAKVGVRGKKYTNNILVKDYRNDKKKSFSYKDTKVEDIDFLLQFNPSNIPSRCYSIKKDNRTELTLDLLLSAFNIHGSRDSNDIVKFIEKYQESWMSQYTKMVSDIATELSISLKQNCSNNQAIIKKLGYTNLHMVIIPTAQASRIFVSFGWFQEDEIDTKIPLGNVFKLPNEYLNFRYTDFVSFNVSKLTNLVRCESMCLSLLIFWMEFYKIPGWIFKTVEEGMKSDTRVYTMLMFTLLVLLNDKSATEEAITLSRYIHMESSVVFPAVSRPSKMYDKLDPIIRSRLQVFIYKRLDMLMKEYSKVPASNQQVDYENKTWKGYLNPFCLNSSGDLDALSDQDQMLSLCYLGYLKNKDEDAESNSSGKLLSKIIGLESLLPKNDDGSINRSCLGETNPKYKEIKKHEFNISLIKSMTNHIKGKIKSKVGVHDAKNYIGKQFLRNLTFQTMDSFSTLKASSNFSEDWYVYDPSRTYHRSKVIEKVLQILNNKDDNSTDVLIVDFLLESLEEIENRDSPCMHICIFKKNQHGGLREIYVLEITARIIQKILEDLSRTILHEFDSEIMTHPKNKFLIPEHHNRMARRQFGENYRTFSTSDDAAKWNQGHYVTKFAILLCDLTPDWLHGFIIRSIQLWLDKRIKINDELLKIFMHEYDLKSSDSNIQDIFNCFKGRMSLPWMKAQSGFIQTESGMMQGILHYTSSLFHCAYLEYLSHICNNMLNLTLQNMKSRPAILDIMESSDDSSMFISVPSFKDERDVKISMQVYLCFKLKEHVGTQIGIYKSIKSTTNTLFLMEFNSEFFYFGDVHRPTFRWVNSSVLISEQDNLLSRQEEMYNLITSIIQGGGSLLLSWFCQFSQGLLHYRLLGSSVSDLWPIYALYLQYYKDPGLGFFLMDHQMTAGIPGLNYLIWLACRKTSLGLKYKLMLTEELNNNDEKSIKKITEENINVGLFSRVNQVVYGNNRRWKKLMDLFPNSDELLDEIEQDPSILYFKPVTVKELRARLLIKVKSPGVIASLAKNNPLPRIIASSVFILSRSIINTNSSFVLDMITTKSTKISLISEVLLSHIKQKRNDNKLEIGDFNVTVNHQFEAKVINLININKFGEIKTLLQHMYSSYYEHQISFELFCAAFTHVKSNSKYNSDLLQLLADFTNINLIKCEKLLADRYIVRNVHVTENPMATIYFSVHINFLSILNYDEIVCNWNSNLNDNNYFTRHQESLLFPFMGDYETIRSIVSGLTMKNGIAATNNRRRQRSDIRVTGNEDSSCIKMEQVMMYFWFNKNPSQLSIQTIESLFKEYKASIPWLDKDINTTLKNSPMSNHVQLRNFISRRDLSTRVVHLVGAFGKNRYGNINIATVIRHNLSNSIIFPEIIDEGAKIQNDNLKTFLHISSCLLDSPCTEDFKNAMLIDLLYQSPMFKVNDVPSSKISKISVIQEIVQNNPDLYLPINANSSRYDWAMKKIINEYPKSRIDDISHNTIILTEKYRNMGDANTICDMIIEELAGSNMYIATIVQGAFTGSDLEEMREELVEYELSCVLTEELYKEIIGTMAIRFYVDGRINNLDDLNKVRGDFETKLKVIQSQIDTMKLGMYGFYIKTQQYNKEEKRFQGEGIWKGRFDDVLIQIHINSDKEFNFIEFITINTSRQFNITMAYLKQWCRDNNIINDRKSAYRILDNKDILYYVKDFKEMNKPIPGSCPIYVRPFNFIGDLNFTNYRIEFGFKTIRLIGYYSNIERSGEHINRFVTIISLPLSLNSIILDFRNDPIHDYRFIQSWPLWLEEWVRFMPSPHELSWIINEVSNNTNNDEMFNVNGIDKTKFQDWCYSQWKTRLTKKIGHPTTYNKDDYVIKPQVKGSMSSMMMNVNDDLSLRNLYTSFMKSLDTIKKESFDDIFKIVMDIFETSDITQNYIDFQREEEERDSTTIERIHPYFDLYIRDLVEDSIDVVFSNFSMKDNNFILPETLKNYKNDLLYLFKYDERDIHIHEITTVKPKRTYRRVGRNVLW